METKLKHWLAEPESLNAEAVMKLPLLMEQYPYCAAYRVLYCIALANTHSTRLTDELQKTATMLPDSLRLFELVSNGEYDWIELMHRLQKKQSEQQEKEDNFALVDQYLQQGDADLSALLASDYQIEETDEEDQLPAEEDTEAFALIDSFLEADNQGQLFVPQAEKREEEVPNVEPSKIREKAFLTESLAKLYVKQHKYERALAIFSSLNLENSEKNSYFADQIRFLEKVIAIEAEKNSKNNNKQK